MTITSIIFANAERKNILEI